MTLEIVTLLIVAALMCGIVIGACANIDNLNKCKEEHSTMLKEHTERLEKIEADLYDVEFTEEELEIKRIFEKYDAEQVSK